MGPRITSIRDVAEKHLCTGCGVCAFVQPEAVRMVDVVDQGRRPLPLVDARGRDLPTNEALASCPGARLEHGSPPPESIKELQEGWGPILEVWEGYAADPEVRFQASSGGAASALALHGIENLGMHGLLHIAARPDAPYLNQTVLSTTRAQILEATGSRYAPASPCDSLDLIESAPAPCVFIGKPCDVAGAMNAAAIRPSLARNLGLTIGIFCAGTPSTQGTLEMLKVMGIDDPDSLLSVRYRGRGWPGRASARVKTDTGEELRELTYEESWGKILQKHRQWRCYVCADHTGEFADIAVGDPWYREIPEGEPGRSLILVRTSRGRQALHTALASGVLVAERVAADRLPASQPNLLRTRGGTWGRIATSRIAGVAAPTYRNLPTFPAWQALPARQRAQSIYGTVKRIVTRRLYRRRRYDEFHPPIDE